MSNFYLGGAYRYLSRYLYTVSANATVGRFYNAVQGSFRVSIPGQVPLYFEPIVTFNNLNYQDTGGLLGENAETSQLVQRDLKTGINIGFSPNYRSRYVLDAAAFTNRDRFANTQELNSTDVLDLNRFQGVTAGIRFERNSLNARQYATKGRHVEFAFRAITGQEKYEPGSTANGVMGRTKNQRWIRGSIYAEQYYSLTKNDSVGAKTNAWGYLVDAVASTQGPFATYRSSLTTSAAFLPLPDSRTLFLDNYRGTAYAGAGLRYVRGIFRGLEWRTEGFAHVLVRPWRQDAENRVLVRRSQSVSRPYLTLMTGLVYQTPVGPLSVQAIHYDDSNHRFGVFAHIGYVLFRERSLE
jgi:NTE family protein